MSTKTLRKRIALVAVSAMGFGLLTSVSAHATFGATTGSVGLVGDFAGTALSKTATVLSTGSIKLALTAGESLTVSSGAVISTSDSPADINGSQTCVDNAATSATIVPTGAVGSTFTIGLRSSGVCATGAGNLIDSVTVTIAGASTAGTPSATYSTAYWSTLAGTPTTADLNTCGSGSSSCASAKRSETLYIYAVVKDVYNAAVTNAGAYTVEVSPGAVVGFGGAGSYTTAVSSTAGGTPQRIYIKEKTAGTGWNGTVKISYNGVLIATKSGKITGDITKVEASATAVGSLSPTTTGDAIEYQAYDSAGNIVAATTGNFSLGSTSNSSVVSAVSVTNANSSSAAGKVEITCGIAGSSDVVLQYVNAAGAIVKSNAVKSLCGGDAATYSVSWDKSSYKQGDIAKLTVKFFDSKGNAANSVATVSKSTTGDQVITAPQMTRVTQSAGFAADATADETGSITYTYTVGTDGALTPGIYTAVVSFPKVNALALGGKDQAASYTITSTGSSISNAEVLAAIVKLIASINKQITALQKLLTKKK